MSTTGTAARPARATPRAAGPARLLRGAAARLRRPGTLALACVLVLAVAVTVQPQFDPDFWWHALIGDRILHGDLPRADPFTFTAAGHRFILQEWGSEALDAVLLQVGMWAVIVAGAATAMAGLVLSLDRARRHTSSDAVLAVAAGLGLGVGISVFGPRPQMVTFTGCAALLWIIDRHRARGGLAVLWLVPLLAVWGNLHGGFSLGLGLGAVVVVADVISLRLGLGGGARPERVRSLALTLVLAAAAVCVNPNGPAVYLYAGGLLGNSTAQASLDEWRSPSFHDPTFLPLAALIALLLVVAPRARRIDLSDALLAGAGIVLSLYAVRNLAIAVVTTMPLLAAGLEGTVAERRRGARASDRGRALAGPFCAAVLTASIGIAGVVVARHLADPRNDDSSSAYPTAVSSRICAGPEARLFTPYGSAGWLLFELDRSGRSPCSGDRVFIFGEVYLIGPAVLADYLEAAAAGPRSMAILDSHGVDAVWQPRGSALAGLLTRQADWTCVWADSADVIYARSPQAPRWGPDRGRCDEAVASR